MDVVLKYYVVFEWISCFDVGVVVVNEKFFKGLDIKGMLFIDVG